MAYVREWDDLPWEAQLGVATTFAYWPRLEGRLVQADPSTAQFSINDPDGGVVSTASATVSAVDIGRPVSRIDISIPAISTLGEEYSVRLVWGLPADIARMSEVRSFDVVRWPFNQPALTFNDLVEERSDVAQTLDRIGQRLGYTAGDEAREYAASVFAGRARGELYAMAREVTARRAAAAATETRADPDRIARTFVRPNLIINRDELLRTERALAMKALYQSIAKAPEDGDGEADQLYRHFRAEALLEWGRVRIRYDGDEDLIPDETIADHTRVTFQRRRQA